jgi:uracil-DNA glycosylase
MSTIRISESWKKHLEQEFNKEYFQKLTAFVKEEYSRNTIHPAGPNIFRAFELCSFEDCRVVVLGQDPYHSPKTAIGLSFAVEKGNRLPPSLQNIYKELETDLGIPRATHGDLSSWGAQGVLLLNAVLTVQQGKPGSHAGKGWEIFTDAVIKIISDQKENVVFILWGAYAQKKEALIDTKKHFVIKSAHPSPFSAHTGFFGSKPFSKTNEYLASKGLKEINWEV